MNAPTTKPVLVSAAEILVQGLVALVLTAASKNIIQSASAIQDLQEILSLDAMFSQKERQRLDHLPAIRHPVVSILVVKSVEIVQYALACHLTLEILS